jgi:5'-nucleotidase
MVFNSQLVSLKTRNSYQSYSLSMRSKGSGEAERNKPAGIIFSAIRISPRHNLSLSLPKFNHQSFYMKKILYVDMDNVLVDFRSGISRLSTATITEYGEDLDDVPGIFELMDPMPGAVESVHILSNHYDAYILSTAPWNNPSAWRDKLLWIKQYLPEVAHKRLILTHHKNLNKGDFLVDDRLKHGVDLFEGEHIHFGTPQFPDWPTVTEYLMERSR